MHWNNTYIPDANLDESIFFFFFYLGFLSRTFTIHRTAGEGGGYFFNSSLPLRPASQTLRHKPGDYCREFTSAHSQQLESDREPLVSERKPLTTKLCAHTSIHTCLEIYQVQLLWAIVQRFSLKKIKSLVKSSRISLTKNITKSFECYGSVGKNLAVN